MSDSAGKFGRVYFRVNVGVKAISSFEFGFGSQDSFSSGPVKKPPTHLLFIGLGSISLGLFLGVLGEFVFGGTDSQRILFGFLGYLLTVLVPIVLLQIIRSQHLKSMSNKDVTYDRYAGDQLQSKFLRVVLAGLILAALPLWVLFSPLGERAAVWFQ